MPWLLGRMTYVVRSDAGVTVAPAMRAALRDVDAAIPAQLLHTMDDAMLEAVAEPLFQTRLLTVFSVLALLLAVIGTNDPHQNRLSTDRRQLSTRSAEARLPDPELGRHGLLDGARSVGRVPPLLGA